MTYSRDELAAFTLQKLASIYPQNEQEENLVKEMFEKRASISNYAVLTSMVDVKAKWQEDILQKYVDEKRETMAPENPAELTAEEEAQLDANVITKEKELELQAKLDKRNGKVSDDVEVLADEPIEVSVGDEIETTKVSQDDEPEVTEVKKVKPKKK